MSAPVVIVNVAVNLDEIDSGECPPSEPTLLLEALRADARAPGLAEGMCRDAIRTFLAGAGGKSQLSNVEQATESHPLRVESMATDQSNNEIVHALSCASQPVLPPVTEIQRSPSFLIQPNRKDL